MPLLVVLVAFGLYALWRRSNPSDTSGAAGPDAPYQPPPFVGPGPVLPDALQNIADAIARLEGKPGDINYRNNNPGNLRPAAAAQVAPGLATGSNGGFATFGDQGDGWDALYGYITQNTARHPDWDFYDFFQHYLGQTPGGPTVTDQGNSDQYAEFVAAYLGIDPTVPVSMAIGG